MDNPQKITIVLEDVVARDLEAIKNKLNLKTFSGTIAFSIQMLNWVLDKQKEGYIIKAEKQIGDLTLVEKFSSMIR